MKTYFLEWRLSSGLTQIEVAQRLKVNRQRVWRIERGKSDFTGKYLFGFAIVVNCPHPGDIINRAPDLLYFTSDKETGKTVRRAVELKASLKRDGDN